MAISFQNISNRCVDFTDQRFFLGWMQARWLGFAGADNGNLVKESEDYSLTSEIGGLRLSALL